MSDPCILVSGISKSYPHQPLGAYAPSHKWRKRRKSLAESLSQWVRHPVFSAQSRWDGKLFWALDNVSLEVGKGEVVGIIGPNGAGKSTLLKILARVTPPTRGEARLFGKVGSMLEVGVGFHPDLTGRENVYLNGAILGMKRKEIARKLDQIVAFSEIEQHIDIPVKRYSSGMSVRLAFAVAAHLDPEILLVDEVLAVGDIGFQRKCLEKISSAAKAGQTVLLVSHRMSTVRTLCSRVYWLDSGRLRAAGTAEQIVSDYERTLYRGSEGGHDLGSRFFSNTACGIELSALRSLFTKDGDGHTLQVELRGLCRELISGFGIEIALATLEGVTVCRLTPDLSGAYLREIAGEWSCRFEFPAINHRLAGGDYLLGLKLLGPQGGLMLQATDALLIHVPGIDRFGVGSDFTIDRNGLVPLPVRFIPNQKIGP